MKKIFTLLFATAMLTTAFAQYGQKDQRGGSKANDVYASKSGPGYGHNDKGKFGTYVFTPRERDMQIGQINREYSKKIQAVKNRPFMNLFQKKRMINNLEADRDAEIQQVIFKFKSPKNQFGDFRQNDKKRW